jgi:ABC-2 type transport system permease protein
MRTIIKIAKTELKLLFYSPIAWFLLAVFMIQCGVIYFGSISGYARLQEMGGFGLNFMDTLTSRVFLGKGGLFGSVAQNLYLYIPLLTMSLISREIGSGTIKLLYSSPISVYEIVLGKYLAMVIYSLLLVAVVGIFVVLGIFNIVHAETGMLLSALLGFFLLLCTYAAIGLFMSCLTTYQVVAAICTFVMIGVLSYIGMLWQRVAFVRELTYFLSINGRTVKMLTGLITTKDLIYFVVIVYIFLGLSILKLKAGMESKPMAVKVGRYVAVIASALLVGYITSIPALTGYFDVTFNKNRTITPRVQQILADLGDAPLEVTAYANLLDQYNYLGNPEFYNENESRWEIYRRFKTNINLHTVAYYDSAYANEFLFNGKEGQTLKQLADQNAKMNDMKLSYYLTPEQIRKKIDLKPESNRYVMQLEWKGKKTFLRIYNDQMMWPGETEVAAALMRLQGAKIPVIGFVTGDLERDINKLGDRDYKGLTNLNTFRNSLVNQGFDVQTVSLEKDEIPAGIEALVLADPRLELTPGSMAKIRQYIHNGGNMLIAGEPGRQQFLNPLLSQIGVQLDGTILQEDKQESPDKILALPTSFAAGMYKPMKEIVEDSLLLQMPGVTAVSYKEDSGFTIHPLMVSDPVKSWKRVKPVDVEMMISGAAGPEPATTGGGAVQVVVSQSRPVDRTQAGVVRFDPKEGDVKGPITTAVSLSRKVNGKEQRIIVAGDADFLNNREVTRPGRSNFQFSTAIFSWLSNGVFPIDTSRPKATDKRVTVTMDQVELLRIIFIWIIPALILIFASILLIRRKRK